MALLGAAAGYCFAVSPRLAIAGLSVALSLLIAQGVPLEPADALPAFLFATVGGVLQAVFSLLVYAAGDRQEERGAAGWDTHRGVKARPSSGSCCDRPRSGTDRCDRLCLRPAHRPVRAVHGGDHDLRGLARRHAGRAGAGTTGQRALATAIGIAIAAFAFLLWSNLKRGEEMGETRPLAPPETAAR